MATQRLTVATLAGAAAAVVRAMFRPRQTAFDPVAIDHFAEQLRSHGMSLPIVYFSEWVDRWSMGDEVPGSNPIEGQRYQAACLTPAEAVRWAEQCGSQFPEQQWLANRLQEAATA